MKRITSAVRQRRRLAFVAAFLLCGGIIIALAYGATPTAHMEAESAARTAPATTGTDTAASGGSYVQFGPPVSSPSSPVPLGVPGAWSLKFNDDFTGTSLDLTKWRPNWLAGSDTAITPPVNSSEKSCYDPAQVSVSGGSLLLKAVQRSCTANNGTTYNYASGLVQTNSDYRFTYGYMEARMYLPGGGAGSATIPANWPAFWSNGQNWPTDGEIDVMEVLGDDVCWHFHYSGGDPGGCPWDETGTGWHTFGANWQPGSIKFYYDGVLVGTVSSGVTSKPMYLIANYGLSGSEIIVPSTVQVDYVRVWQ